MTLLRTVRWLAPALLALAVAGCGPQYRTFTNYEPPADDVGRDCALRCLDERRLCRRENDLGVQQCRIDAQKDAEEANLDLERDFRIDLKRFRAGLYETPPEKPAAVRPDYGRCSREASGGEARCGQDFDLCYQTCGGRVIRETHCVANCDG